MLSLPDFPVRQRDFLLQIARAITAQLDLGEVLRRVLEASVAMIAGRVGLVALRNPVDGLFYVRAYRGIPGDLVADLNYSLNELLKGISTGVDYTFLDEQLRAMASKIDSDLVQSVAMPLIFADNPLGLLIVFRSYEAIITPNDLQILQSFADQAAIAVNNAQLYERIVEERRRLAAILDHSGDGVLILDAELNVLQVNRAFEIMTGWSSELAVGLGLEEVVSWRRCESMDLPEALEHGWPNHVPEDQRRPSDTLYVDGELSRRDGLHLSVGITYAPLFSPQGKIINIIGNLRDITNFRRAQEMQNVFISTVSHELRTPVALIKGYASTLTRPDANWNEQIVRNSLEVIEDEADRLTTLIDDLLTASRIQAESQVKLHFADVRLDLIAAHSAERFRHQTQNHEIELSFTDNFPAIQGDEKLLRQVVDNLITNAIKYSPQGGRVTVGGRYTDNNVTFFVRDEGVGIPEQEQHHIFERFYRVDNKLTASAKGTGLGLFLVKAIVEAHHGTIHVKSQPAHGSTFYFTLPRD